MTDEELGWAIRGLPNGCCLSHLSRGPEYNERRWRVLDALGNTMASGVTVEEAMGRFVRWWGSPWAGDFYRLHGES